jgi:hypothetical protein
MKHIRTGISRQGDVQELPLERAMIMFSIESGAGP